MQSNPQIEKHFLILQIAVIAFAALLTTSVIAETMVAPHERVTVMRVIDGDSDSALVLDVAQKREFDEDFLFTQLLYQVYF